MNVNYSMAKGHTVITLLQFCRHKPCPVRNRCVLVDTYDQVWNEKYSSTYTTTSFNCLCKKRYSRVLELSVYCTAIEVTFLRQTDRQTHRQTDRRTERQTEVHTGRWAMCMLPSCQSQCCWCDCDSVTFTRPNSTVQGQIKASESVKIFLRECQTLQEFLKRKKTKIW